MRWLHVPKVGLLYHKARIKITYCKFCNIFVISTFSVPENFYLKLIFIQIRWHDRVNTLQSIIDTCLCSDAKTDCWIREPTSLSSKWGSHNLHGPSLWFEVAVSIQHGNITWVYGQFPWGSWSWGRKDTLYFVEKKKKEIIDDPRREMQSDNRQATAVDVVEPSHFRLQLCEHACALVAVMTKLPYQSHSSLSIFLGRPIAR